MNQFKDIYGEFKIDNYENYSNSDNLKEAKIAATILKVQERKTNKGNPYAVIKFSDLSCVFELFIFSDILEKNRDILIEGSSVLLTVLKVISDDEKKTNKFNVYKISSLKSLYETPIKNIKFYVNDLNQLHKLSEQINEIGNTEITIKYKNNDKYMVFDLDNKRKVNRNSIKELKKHNISLEIN